MREPSADLLRFVRGDCDPAHFPHREHVRMSFEMLRRHSFPETALHYSQALRTMATRAGNPGAYHETVTVAFLSLVAERVSEVDDAIEFDRFARDNPDLMDKNVLARWYRPSRLASDRARQTFILPDPTRDR